MVELSSSDGPDALWLTPLQKLATIEPSKIKPNLKNRLALTTLASGQPMGSKNVGPGQVDGARGSVG